MPNATITTTVQRNEVEVSAADWAAEAVALAQRVNQKIRPAPTIPQIVAADEYEPQSLDDTTSAKRPAQR